MSRALRVEWLKLKSARGTWILLAVAVLAAGLAAAGTSAQAKAVELGTMEGQRGIAHTAGSGAIFVLILAILSVTNEFRYGTVVLSTLADPRRVATIGAKAVMAAAAGLVVDLASVATNVAVGSAYVSARGSSYKIGNREIWSTFAGSILWAVMFGILGVAIGAFVRKGPAAISGSLAWLLILETLVGQVISDVRPYLPGAAGQAIGRVPDGFLLTMWQGGLVAAGYLGVAAILALGVTRHRDV